MPLRGVLFDLDDTLFDHDFATERALASLHAGEPAFAAWTPDDLVARHSVVLEAMHREVLTGERSVASAREARFSHLLGEATGAPVPDDRAADLARQYREAYEQSWRAVPGALDLLRALRDRGLAIGIVTNNLTAEQRLKLEYCALAPLVDALITSEDAGAPKPEARIFRDALSTLGLDAREAVMVGDAWATDIAGALTMGIRPVWFNRRGQASPDAKVAELTSLEPVDRAVAVIEGR
jgi:putative hydrolase of the HAD superfamily